MVKLKLDLINQKLKSKIYKILSNKMIKTATEIY